MTYFATLRRCLFSRRGVSLRAARHPLR